jgi:hypothetical protein
VRFGANPVTLSMVGTLPAVVVVVGGATVDDSDELFVAYKFLPFGVKARSVTSPLKKRSLLGATHSLVVGVPVNLTSKMAFTGDPELEFAPPR